MFTLVALVIIIPISSFAFEENGVIEMPYSDNTPVIDGRFSTINEWSDASVTQLSGQGHTVYVLSKHDRDNIYFIFDAISDQIKYTNQQSAHFANLFFDTDNDGGDVDTSDIYFNGGIGYNGDGTVYNDNNGRTLVYDPKIKEYAATTNPQGHKYAMSYSSKNSPYESGRDHFIHEFQIPISYLHKQDSYGLAISYRLGVSGNSDPNAYRLVWPPTLSGTVTSAQYSFLTNEWGSIVSRDNSITSPPVPVISISSNSMNFGNVAVSEKSESKSITISNQGTSNLKINSLRTTGEFSVTGITTPLEISPNQKIDFNVIFGPQSLGEKTGSVLIVSNDLSKPTYTIQISGKGTEKGQLGGGCLIATATYGSELAPQVQQLRELRDNSLLQTESGTAFMSGFNQFYYSFSPAIADFERENPVFKEIVKIAITPMLSTLSIMTLADDSEAGVLGFGISVILLNIGIYVVGPAFGISKLRSHIQRKQTS